MPTGPAPPAAASRFLSRLVQVRPGEGWILFWATAYFFCLLYSYYLLRPMREAFGIAKGADKLPWLMTGTMLVMLLANPAFAAVVSRLPRARFIPLSYRFCSASLLLFYGLFRFLPGHGGVVLGYAFYIWLSVFNLFAVSLFWAFMADGFNEEQGKRLFGFITAGGTLGAILGAGTTQALIGGLAVAGAVWKLDPSSLVLAALIALELAVACVGKLAPRFHLSGALRDASREPGPGLFAGIKLIARSPYLATMGLYLLLFTITSTLLYLQQGVIVERSFAGHAARTAAFARMDVWVNALTLVTQLFLTSRILTRWGVPAVLCLMPVLTLAGFGSLWLWPTFGTLVVFQVLRRGLHYAVDRPCREILYIPLGPEEKYKSKPFIDTFVYRGGDLLGIWTPAALALARVPVGAAAMGVAGVWLAAGVWLGKLQQRATGDRRASAGAKAPASPGAVR